MHLLVIVQNNKRCTVQVLTQNIKIKKNITTISISMSNLYKTLFLKVTNIYMFRLAHVPIIRLHINKIKMKIFRGIYNLHSCSVWVCVCVGFVMCGCFGTMCTCIYCVLYCLYCVFVLFRLCIFILTCFICTGVRTTATE